jgi:hypothetical protein
MYVCGHGRCRVAVRTVLFVGLCAGPPLGCWGGVGGGKVSGRQTVVPLGRVLQFGFSHVFLFAGASSFRFSLYFLKFLFFPACSSYLVRVAVPVRVLLLPRE